LNFQGKRYLKSFNKPLVLSSPLPLIFLTACGGSGTSSGSVTVNQGPTESFSGFVVKGPLQNATVFADYDGDGIKGDHEPSVLTNSDGSYTLNAISNFSRYCC